MSTPIFPTTLPGIEWGLKRTPLWSTLVQTASSGYTVRIGEYPFPYYRWETSISILDASSAVHSFQDFFGFINSLMGRTLPFLYLDDYDYTVTGQAIATGDGATTAFQLQRTFGGSTEPVFAPKGTVTMKVNGSTTAATVDANTGIVTFGSAPAAASLITADFQYYWRCFLDKDDGIEYNSFDFQGLEVKDIAFTSCRA